MIAPSTLGQARLHNRLPLIIMVATVIAVAVTGMAWYQASVQLGDLRVSQLRTIAELLKEEQELIGALRPDPTDEKHSGVLGSYLAEIRADGVVKHADIKQRLDRLAENNSEILALLNVYTPYAKTAAFSAEANKFQRYAIAWRDRWNSVMELFMAGGNYPAAEVPFPKEFLSAVQAEMEAVK